jgi:hypothetical protein
MPSDSASGSCPSADGVGLADTSGVAASILVVLVADVALVRVIQLVF